MSGKNIKRFSLALAALLGFEISASAQITTANNGLNTPIAGTVQLGGSLLQNTTIDQSGYGFHLKNGNTPLLSILPNGNVGFGITSPGALISFPGIELSDDPIGISWYPAEATGYAIHRTAGSWAAPNYQQLRLGWKTGIVLDPGNGYGKSYVDVQGSGLRVTQGSIGIGTANPQSKFHLVTSTADATTDFLITDNNGGVILSARNDQVISVGSGTQNAQLVIGGTGAYAGIYSPAYGAGASNIVSYKDYNGNVRMTLDLSRGSDGRLGIGNTTPHSKLEVGTNPDDDITPYTPTIWDSYSARINGNLSIFSTGTATTYGDSYELDFYARYGNAGQSIVTNKAGYIKATAINDYNYPPQAAGRGTLILGSTNTNYNNNQFINVPALYVSNGQIGIGVTTPQSQLHTNGSVRFAGLTNDNAQNRVIVSDANGNLSFRDAATLGGSAAAGWGFGGNSVPTSAALGTTSNFDLPIITNNIEQMRIGANGNVGIGTTSIATYKLSVNGNIRTRKVRVDQDTWADYVFENNYQLRPINELEQYIQTEKHLPDVPSAAEVKKEGLDLGDNQAVLLKKIEELTLYVIEQNKKIEALQKLVLQQQSEKEAKKK